MRGFGQQSALMLTQVHKGLRQSAQKRFFFSQRWHSLGRLVLVPFLEGQRGEFGPTLLFLSPSGVQPAHPQNGHVHCIAGARQRLDRGLQLPFMEGSGGEFGVGAGRRTAEPAPGRGQSPRTGTGPQDRAPGRGQSPGLAPAAAGCPRLAAGCAPTCRRVPPTRVWCPQPPAGHPPRPAAVRDAPRIYQSAPGGCPRSPPWALPPALCGMLFASPGTPPPAPPRAAPRAVASPRCLGFSPHPPRAPPSPVARRGARSIPLPGRG